MASRAFSLSRSLFTARQTLAFIHTAPYSSSVSSVSSPLFSRLSLLRLRPLAAVGHSVGRTYLDTSFYRGFSTRQTQSSLNDSNPNWSNRPPKETILLDGCDFEHWLVVTEKPDENMTRDEIIDMYIETLAKVVGSKEEARMKIYSVSTRHYFAFGALVPEELSYKLKELPNVRWVLPDSYLDVKNRDYGGEPFINGQAVPYDPKYHEEWVRNNAKAMERNRRNDRPRNFDRSRNFERRRQNMQNQTPSFPNQMQNQPPPNMQGAPPHPNMPGGAPHPNMPGGAPHPNMGGPMQTPNNFGGPGPIGGMPPNNMRGPGPNNGVPPNMAGPGSMGGYNPGNSSGPIGAGPPPNTNISGAGGPNNMGGYSNPGPGSMGGYNPVNSSGPIGGGPPPNTNIGGAGGPNNMGGYSNPGWQGQGGNMPNYQNGGGYPQQQPGPAQNYQGNYGVMGNNGISGNPHDGNLYQGMRDMPPPNNRQ